MWFGKNATLKDYLIYFSKRKGIKIAFYTPNMSNKSFLNPYFLKYNEVMASTRLRVNDIIFYSLKLREMTVRFYNPLENFDIIVFQKSFDKYAYSIAKKYKKKNCLIIMDINVNYFDNISEHILENQRNDIKNFLTITDIIFTTTKYLKNYIIENDLFSEVEVIPEIISDEFFKIKKIHIQKDEINFLYVGYAIKALELESIKNDLEKLARIYNANLIIISERRPKLDIKIKKTFIKYNQFRLATDMIKGDIFLNPRDLNETYNLGHSFTKIGYPMALGIPIVTSPIPSYLDSPAILYKDGDKWFNLIEYLINNYELRNQLGNKGRYYCYKHFSKEKIMKQYIEIFKSIIKKE